MKQAFRILAILSLTLVVLAILSGIGLWHEASSHPGFSVSINGDDLDLEGLGDLVAGVRALPNLNLRGLMTMPPWSEDPEMARPYFSRLRQLAQQHSLTELSMGMSHDFEVAIEEGSTMIRVGTAIFGKRIKPLIP